MTAKSDSAAELAPYALWLQGEAAKGDDGIAFAYDCILHSHGFDPTVRLAEMPYGNAEKERKAELAFAAVEEGLAVAVDGEGKGIKYYELGFASMKGGLVDKIASLFSASLRHEPRTVVVDRGVFFLGETSTGLQEEESPVAKKNCLSPSRRALANAQDDGARGRLRRPVLEEAAPGTVARAFGKAEAFLDDAGPGVLMSFGGCEGRLVQEYAPPELLNVHVDLLQAARLMLGLGGAGVYPDDHPIKLCGASDAASK